MKPILSTKTARRHAALLVSLAILALTAAPGSFFVGAAQAATTCTFFTAGKVMHLKADCVTDATILIPNNFTLNGNNHTITAVDPPAGHFLGAVVMNAGAKASVINLKIDTDDLANVCDGAGPPDNRLRGILFIGTSGAITNNTVKNINQGMSGCQEGNAIEVRNAPFDGTHPATKKVTIIHNTVADYQKGGIISNGDVDVVVKGNTVKGFGPVDFIAQNGIQLGFGAKGVVQGNTVSGNQYTPQTFGSGGILLYNPADKSDVSANDVDESDVGIWLAGASKTQVKANKTKGSTWDGIALDDQSGPVAQNKVMNNQSTGNDTGIGLYGAGAIGNTVDQNVARENETAGFYAGFGAADNTFSQNLAQGNPGDGILVEADDHKLLQNKSFNNGGIGIAVDGDGNTVKKNIAKFNTTSDVQNTGANAYSGNICDSSSGPPVDCGASPLHAHQDADLLPAPQPYE